MRTRYLLAISSAVALTIVLLTACGGSDSATSTPGASTEPASGGASSLGGRAVVTADLTGVSDKPGAIEALEADVQTNLGKANIQSNISQTSDDQITIEFTPGRDFHGSSTDLAGTIISVLQGPFAVPVTVSGVEIH